MKTIPTAEDYCAYLEWLAQEHKPAEAPHEALQPAADDAARGDDHEGTREMHPLRGGDCQTGLEVGTRRLPSLPVQRCSGVEVGHSDTLELVKVLDRIEPQPLTVKQCIWILAVEAGVLLVVAVSVWIGWRVR